jgi:hypothetical protein
MRLISVIAGACALAVVLIMTWGANVTHDYTEASARQEGEKLFIGYLSEIGMQRSDFGPAVVELADGDALVSFRSTALDDEDVVITLGKDGSQGISPYLPSRDFKDPTVTGRP